MFDPFKFTVQKAKPLPILLMLDVSGSMSGVKIDTLNEAVRTMIETFADEEKMETEILVSIITFGEEVKRLFPFTPASRVNFTDLTARGGTPLGVACSMAKAMIEDKDETPGRAYRPTIILVSDGHPGDNWQPPLQSLIHEGRSAKCDRMAMAIGSDADLAVLGKFVEGTPNPLFEAHRASEIKNFFKRVTMSVTMRTKSKDPNQIPTLNADSPVSPQTSSAVPPNPSTADSIKTASVKLDGVTILSPSSNSSPSDDEDSYF